MDRRSLLKIIAGLPLVGDLLAGTAAKAADSSPASRVRPGDPGWPSDDAWKALGRGLEGELIKVDSPLSACVGAPADACAQLFKELKNPYYLGDEVGLTQSLGWVGAWTSRPSVYAVAAQSTADVVAAVNFARTHNLRLVVKGGGHSYQGSSNAADSLLDLDPPHARRHAARRLRRRGLRGTGSAAARGFGRTRRDLGPYLQRGDDQGRPLCPGRRLH